MIFDDIRLHKYECKGEPQRRGNKAPMVVRVEKVPEKEHTAQNKIVFRGRHVHSARN